MEEDDERTLGDYITISWTIIKYLTKFIGLTIIFPILIYIMSYAYLYFCKGFTKILAFFMILLKLPTLKIFGAKITNYFAIFDAFIELVIGTIYCLIGLVFILIMILVSIFASLLMANIY